MATDATTQLFSTLNSLSGLILEYNRQHLQPFFYYLHFNVVKLIPHKEVIIDLFFLQKLTGALQSTRATITPSTDLTKLFRSLLSVLIRYDPPLAHLKQLPIPFQTIDSCPCRTLPSDEP